MVDAWLPIDGWWICGLVDGWTGGLMMDGYVDYGCRVTHRCMVGGCVGW